MRGADGSAVTITVQSPNAAPTNIIMRREKVANSAIVESHMLPSTSGKKIGYLLLPTFYEQQLSRKTRTALTTLMQKNNDKLDGLVIDMRNNGGGEFDILSSNLGFFTSGNVGAFVNRTGISETVTVRAERIGNSQSVPLVILTSGNTASFAEVFTGVLQYKRGAKLVGQNSMGNIEILRPHEFDDGSQLWLAEQAFRLPNGTSWEGVGLKPDISINKMFYEFTTENDPAITAAIDLLSK
jgi:C-terminal peptidase prc